jgi:predicted ester cyclase
VSEETKAVALRFIEEEDRTGGVPRDLCAAGYTARIAGFPAMDVDAFNTFAETLYGAFAPVKHNVEDVIVEGDRVAVAVRLTGRHTASFQGERVTNAPIEVGSIAIFRIAGGKVAELRVELDQMGLLQQIGVLPSPAAARR